MLKNFSKIFSATYVLNMLNGQNIPDFKSIYSSINLHEDTKIKDVFNAYYNFLLANYKNEYVYKNSLIRNIKNNELLHNDALFSELNIGKDSRVDIAHFSQSNHAYEIKTEFDTFNRLEKQLMDYTTGFEYVSIVIPETKLKSTLKVVTKDIGIMVLSKDASVNVYRTASSNLDLVTHGGLFSLLHEQEFSSLLKKHSGHSVNLTSLALRKSHFREFKSLNAAVLHADVVKIIQKRVGPQKLKQALDYIPNFLFPIALNMGIQKEVSGVISMLNSSIHEFKTRLNILKPKNLLDF